MEKWYPSNNFLCIDNCLRDKRYKARIDSTGFFFAALQTGRKVATTTVTNATAISTASEVIPNTKSDALIKEINVSLITEQSVTLAIIEITTQIAAITKDSEKKILNTSKLLAPTARKIPISCFL